MSGAFRFRRPNAELMLRIRAKCDSDALGTTWRHGIRKILFRDRRTTLAELDLEIKVRTRVSVAYVVSHKEPRHHTCAEGPRRVCIT